MLMSAFQSQTTAYCFQVCLPHVFLFIYLSHFLSPFLRISYKIINSVKPSNGDWCSVSQKHLDVILQLQGSSLCHNHSLQGVFYTLN